jgi:Glycosyl hydrolase family 9/Carbohydrate binding module (family 6)
MNKIALARVSSLLTFIVAVTACNAQVPPLASPTNAASSLSNYERRYEAEHATLLNGSRIQDASNASGTKVVGAINNIGAAMTLLSVDGGAGGAATLQLRFSNGYSNARSLSVYINGSRVHQVSFASTGSWNTFADSAAFQVDLRAGSSNEIRIQRDTSDDPAADIDFLKVTSSAPPPPSSTAVRYEAEAGVLSGGARVQDASNASGGRVVGALNDPGGSVTVSSVNGGAGGAGRLHFRYANGYNNQRSLSLYVNGSRVQQITFAPTGSWNSFADTTSLSVNLRADSRNELRIQRDANDAPAADIDFISVTPPGTSTTPPPTGNYRQGSGYARALQLGLYFFEAQQSGALTNNRVTWRGAAHLDDGRESGLDLSGGWYDAGDHWKSSVTMGYAATLLAWSGVQFKNAYVSTNQMDTLMSNLRHVTSYLEKTIVDPNPSNLEVFDGYTMYTDIAPIGGPSPNVHEIWSAPEVTDGFTNREAMRVDTTVRGPDVAASLAATFASNAVLLHERGDALSAQRLLQKARKLYRYAESFPFDANSLRDGKALLLRPNGSLYSHPNSYHDPRYADEQLLAAGWLYRAEKTFGDSSRAAAYFDWAKRFSADPRIHPDWASQPSVYDARLQAFGEWKNQNVPEYTPLALLLWRTLEREAFNDSLLVNLQKKYLDLWSGALSYSYSVTPGGLTYRSNTPDLLLKINLNSAYVAMFYAATLATPEEKTRYYGWAKRQMDYALGNNPLGLSYVVGYGSRWPKHVHHRGATGSWAGFDNVAKDHPLFLNGSRHILYGGLVGGPTIRDKFPDNDPLNHLRHEVALDFNAGMMGVLAGLVATESDPGTPDTFLPPPNDADAVRNTSLNLNNTDLEFFADARQVSSSTSSQRVEIGVNNRTRWPARVTDRLSTRVFLLLEPGVQPQSVSVTLESSQGAMLSALRPLRGNIYFAELSFTGQRLLPNYVWDATSRPGKAESVPNLSRRTAQIRVDGADLLEVSLGSTGGLTDQPVIQPSIAVYDNGTLVSGREP